MLLCMCFVVLVVVRLACCVLCVVLCSWCGVVSSVMCCVVLCVSGVCMASAIDDVR